MRSRNQKQIDWTLIRKRIDGCLTDEEGQRLEQWIDGDERRRRFVERASRYYERELPVVDESRISKAWQVFARGQEEKRRRQLLVRWSWSAVASILLVLGTWYWWQRPVVSQRGGGVIGQEISIGTYQARLFTSDGNKIDITPGYKERVIIDRNVNVLLDSTSLSYVGNEVAGDTLYHTIEVPRGGEFHLTLSDGSRVWLNAESKLTYPLIFGKAERKVSLEGEAYFEVEPGKGSFLVEAGGMDVRVLGTAFNVNAYENEATVRATLVRGKVEVVVKDDALRRMLVPGEQAMLNRTTGQLEVEKVNTSLYIQWIKGQFVFRDAPLSDIMRTLARWYQMDYEFTDPELESLCFYGVINRFEQVENLLRQFEKTGKVHFEYQGNKVVIKK